jgi:hypothetical protein
VFRKQVQLQAQAHLRLMVQLLASSHSLLLVMLILLTTLLESSNSGSLVNFSAGTKNVFVTYPAEEAVYQDATGAAFAPQFAASNGLNVNNGTIGSSYTFPTGYNSVEAGDVTIGSGATVTVPSTSRWVIV